MHEVETIAKNKVKLTFDTGAELFEKGLQFSYNKNKNRYNVQGFRKGKAPRKMVELTYGKEVLYEDAIEHILDEAYEKAVKTAGIETFSRPSIDIQDIDKENGIIFTAEVFTKPQIEIDGYTNLVYKQRELAPSDDLINKRIDTDREKNARIMTIEGPVEDGHTAVIDYEGFVDGVAFEGGKGSDYELVIGSHSFIDTFEAQLIGAMTGENRTVNVTFPEQYHAENLKGKPAVFEVTVKEIKKKELPEANDEFAQDISEYDSYEEYRAAIVKELTESATARQEQYTEEQLVKQVADKVTEEIPDVVVKQRAESMAYDYLRSMQQRGIDPNMFLQYMGKSIDDLKKDYEGAALNNIKSTLALEAIAIKENIVITDEDVDKEITETEEKQGMKPGTLKALVDEHSDKMLRNDLRIKKAYEFLKANAIAVPDDEQEDSDFADEDDIIDVE